MLNCKIASNEFNKNGYNSIAFSTFYKPINCKNGLHIVGLILRTMKWILFRKMNKTMYSHTYKLVMLSNLFAYKSLLKKKFVIANLEHA